MKIVVTGQSLPSMDGQELSKRRPRPRSRSGILQLPSTANIPVDEVATLFRCGKCLTAPIKPPVYTCRSGHLNCGSCYRRLSRDCYMCKEPLLGRNQVLEEVMRSLPIQTCAALSDCNVPLRESRSEQSLQLSLQDPALLEKLEMARKEAEVQERECGKVAVAPEAKESRSSELKSSMSNSITSLESFHIKSSARPMPCPYPCGRKVTCSGLVPHFEFHHPLVLLSKVNKNCDIDIKIPFEDIQYTDEDEGRCIIFFVVKIDDREDDGEDFSKSAELLRVTRSSQEMLRRGYFVALLSAGLLQSPVDPESRLLAVWVSALYDFAPLTYSLCVSDSKGIHSFSFKGPPSSLHNDHSPGEVYQRGECLTVPPSLLRDFHDLRCLQLTLNFHSDLPFPFVPPPTTTPWIPDTQGLIL